MGEKGACPFRWPGQYEDEETGLYYNRFRYYDPQRGGYLSKDPIGLKGGLEPYGYVRDPLGETDVFGLSCSSDADKLRENMEAAGVRTPPYPNDAHHIVWSNSPNENMVNARDHLAKLGIDHNDAVNGVFLPATKAVREGFGVRALAHKPTHTKAVAEAVWKKISATETKAAAEKVLREIGAGMRRGTLPN